jgi:hypothetical protein
MRGTPRVSGVSDTSSKGARKLGYSKSGLTAGNRSGTRYPTDLSQYYLFNSSKLKHFRTVTIGYTGQKVHPAIRTGWKFELKQHQQVSFQKM